MRYPVHMVDATPPVSEPLIAVVGAIAVGIFIGAFVIGPALTHNSSGTPAATEARMTYDAMLARPDPSPYRTATPVFDTSDAPHYAAMAREKARAELGGHRTTQTAESDFASPEGDRFGYRASPQYRVMDRHTGVKY